MSVWYVVRVGGPGRGSGLKITSGPHKDETVANEFVKDYRDEIWPVKLCKRYGLLSKGKS